jgi:hypothetical protein
MKVFEIDIDVNKVHWRDGYAEGLRIGSRLQLIFVCVIIVVGFIIGGLACPLLKNMPGILS